MLKQDGRACYLEAIEGLSDPLRQQLSGLDVHSMDAVREIRLIAGEPPLLNVGGTQQVLPQPPVSLRELEQSVISLCGHAVHTHQRELADGYLSLRGGHRAGIAATAVYGADQTLQSVRDVSAIVIRVAHDHTGAAKKLLAELFGGGLCGVLIAGAPGSGKTTLLRDLAQTLAAGEVPGCHAVVMVDERGELSREAGRCCVLRGYDKGDGIVSAVRSLAPQVVLCDEIGTRRDVEAVRWALNCGVAVITTLHARSREELSCREAGRALLGTGAFSRIVFLSDVPCPCTIKEVMAADDLVEMDRNHHLGSKLFDGWHSDCDASAATYHRAGTRPQSDLESDSTADLYPCAATGAFGTTVRSGGV